MTQREDIKAYVHIDVDHIHTPTCLQIHRKMSRRIYTKLLPVITCENRNEVEEGGSEESFHFYLMDFCTV